MSEKFKEKALKYYQKGEKHLASGKYKKAESNFEKSIDFFIKANEIKRAESCSLKLCECFIIEKKYYRAANYASRAAELILRHKIYKNAIKHYQSAIDFYDKVDAEMEILEVFSLIILCYIVQGEFEEGITLLKRKIAKSTFPQLKKNKIIQFTILIINTILQKNPDNLEKIEYQLTKMKLEQGLLILFQTVQQIVNHYVGTIVAITTNKKEIRAGDVIEVKIDVKRPLELQIIESELVFDRIFDLVGVKTTMPDNRTIYFKLCPRFQGNLKIGPISLTCKIDEFQFPLKIQKIIEVLPGKVKLVIESEMTEISTNIGTPVIFTLNLKNIGKGECMNLHLQLSLSEELELIEGIPEKKLHSLGPREEFLFTFRIKAIKKINNALSATLNYEDLEGNQYKMDVGPIPFIAES